MSPRVTLNLGLRYEYYTPQGSATTTLAISIRMSTREHSAIQQFGPGAPLSSEFNAGLGDVSPRLGVAWDVRGDGKTVVRAGGALLDSAIRLTALITISPFGANFPSIGVNNSGTDISLHTPDSITLSNCATSVVPWQWNWNLTGAPIFPTAGTSLIWPPIRALLAFLGFRKRTPCQTGCDEPQL